MTQEEQQETTNTPTTISLQDLVLMLQTIQVLCQRGAFKAEEMTVVGGLHDRLHTFLVDNGVIPSPEQSTQEEQQETQ